MGVSSARDATFLCGLRLWEAGEIQIGAGEGVTQASRVDSRLHPQILGKKEATQRLSKGYPTYYVENRKISKTLEFLNFALFPYRGIGCCALDREFVHMYSEARGRPANGRKVFSGTKRWPPGGGMLRAAGSHPPQVNISKKQDFSYDY